ncbi:hypothetical protein ASPSYDRAFT_271562 [Aspergillus sydowii CBS 593.65]|uniref:Transmembrane protein n=1 Tax=Aspergillus sydowii CBS 593.65 TaxID=1036612 RepID=A0A1L9TWW0_9EURO|nr:uncharacterized protein ASPSYDRAFT_271562 [Aspergillus sydowii CBS 593.65]OJJ63872.1 hypothetical protein ASPSYDRAFT_271562 [Aspergillus sydowii CBS 593.65]
MDLVFHVRWSLRWCRGFTFDVYSTKMGERAWQMKPDDRLRLQLLHSPTSLHLAGSDGGWSSARSRRFQDSATVHLGILRCNRPISRKARLPLLNIISESVQCSSTDHSVRTTLDFFRFFLPRSSSVKMGGERCLSVPFGIFLFVLFPFHSFNFNFYYIILYFLFFFFFFFFFCTFLSHVYPFLARSFLLFVPCRASLLFESFPNPSSRSVELIPFSCCYFF